MLSRISTYLSKRNTMNQHNPYQSPSHYEEDEFDVEYEYAGFWIRVAATLIDTVLMMIVALPVGFVFGMLGLVNPDNTAPFEMFINIVVIAFYIFAWVKYAGTPGKRILKLKILDADTGENLTVGKAILRYIGYILSSLALLLGLIWVAFDSRKQGWHDKIANSVVVKEL